MEKFFESNPPYFQAREEKEHKKSPESLMQSLDFFVKHAFGEVTIQGKENLENIPKDAKVIFAATHLTDFDMPLAYWAVGNDFKIKFTLQSRLKQLSGGDPVTYLITKVHGSENFLPISYKKTAGSDYYKGKFEPDNLDNISKSLDQGDSLLVAAHNPSHDNKLTEKGGYADVYMALQKNALIVPVTVDIHYDGDMQGLLDKVQTFKAKPEVTITIGNPINLSQQNILNHDELETFRALLEKHKTTRLTSDEIEQFRYFKRSLEHASGVVMSELASSLPESKIHKEEEIRSEVSL